jgi:MoaA/NifB/PqqE/SkfB family radical SAM enzyme
MVDYRIDSHKLLYHPERVAAWLKGENIYPIYVEVAPSGSCNHRCIFCALDYIGYKPNMLDKDLFAKNLPIMAEKGIKSMMFAGEGEPLLNPNTPEMVVQAKKAGLDVAMTTNGVLFSPEIAKKCFGAFSWVRFSLNAGRTETYDAVHRARSGDFEKVLDNLRFLVAYKKDNKLATTIGVQMLLIPENQEEVLMLAEQVADIGVDYFSIKPFSQHPLSVCQGNHVFNYNDHVQLEEKLRARYSGRMHIAFRSRAMEKLKWEKSYDCCYGLPFWAYIDASSRVWACSAHLGKEEFCYGDLHAENFARIWEGKQREAVLHQVATTMDVKECREICRLDEINIYLHELKNPGPHVNFI